MDAILDPIGEFWEGFLGNPVVQLASQLIVFYVVLLWLGTAYWAFRDMQARTENPILPYFAAALIIFFTPLLFLFAVVLYLIVRPRETLAEVYERSLAEESLLAEVEKNELCPVCRDRVDADWLVCPNCRTRLHRVCPSCNRLAEPGWPLCAFCGREFERGPSRAGSRARSGASTAAPDTEESPASAADATAEHARLRGATEHLTPGRPSVDSDGPNSPGSLPSGPHPTIGPRTITMPRWPGPLLMIGGAVLAVGALAAGALALSGQLQLDRSILAPLALIGALLFVVGLVYTAVRQIRVRSFLPPERYRGPSVLILLALVLVIASIANVPFSEDAAALLLGDGELTFLGAVVILVSTQLALLLVSWLFVHRPNALAALPSLPGRDPAGALRSGVGWGILAWLGSTLVIVVAAWALEQIGMPPEPGAAERAIALLDPWLILLAVVVLAPIAEEVFFRGVVFNAWLREAGQRWAFIGSSALFAVIHLSLVSLLPIFLLGLALAWVYRRTGNLLAPIAMHATVNGISVALALLVRFDVVRLPV